MCINATAHAAKCNGKHTMQEKTKRDTHTHHREEEAGGPPTAPLKER